jgi:hypothetical protein
LKIFSRISEPKKLYKKGSLQSGSQFIKSNSKHGSRGLGRAIIPLLRVFQKEKSFKVFFSRTTEPENFNVYLKTN